MTLSPAGRPGRAIAAFALLALSGAGLLRPHPAGAQTSKEEIVSGGDATILAASYSREILVIDEATLATRAKIPFKYGIPVGLQLSYDRKLLYATDVPRERVEVFDLATFEAVDSFTLSQGNESVQISGMNVHPSGDYAIMTVWSKKKLADRYTFGRTQSVKFDLRTHEITDTIQWPTRGGAFFGGVTIRFSPDGKLLYFMLDSDILIYETENFTQVDRWEVSRPLEEGMGRFPVSLGFGWRGSQAHEEDGYNTSLVTITDPVQNRRMIALGRVNLAKRSIEYTPIGPQMLRSSVWFSLAPDHKRAYGIRSEIGHYELWTLDLERKRIVKQAPFDGRPRLWLTVSSNGKLLYITGAGGTVDVHDAESYEFLRSVRMDGDMLSFILLPKDR